MERLNALAGRPRFHGLGLCCELESKLAEKGYTHAYLATGQAVPARHFYRHHGCRDLPLLSLGKRLQA